MEGEGRKEGVKDGNSPHGGSLLLEEPIFSWRVDDVERRSGMEGKRSNPVVEGCYEWARCRRACEGCIGQKEAGQDNLWKKMSWDR